MLQGARLVDIALESGAAFTGDGFEYIKPALAKHTLHFIGLLSDGGMFVAFLYCCHAHLGLVPCNSGRLAGAGVDTRACDLHRVLWTSCCYQYEKSRHIMKDFRASLKVNTSAPFVLYLLLDPCFSSPTGVHSRYDQLKQFIEGAAKEGAKRIRVHILTDGRDVPDGSSLQFTQTLIDDLKKAGPSLESMSAIFLCQSPLHAGLSCDELQQGQRHGGGSDGGGSSSGNSSSRCAS